MKNFLCIIKSYCEMPDYEKECVAEDIIIASQIFQRELNNNPDGYYWALEEIQKNVKEITI